MLIALVAALAIAQPELLDRTLALVGGQPITLSDARGAIVAIERYEEKFPSGLLAPEARLLRARARRVLDRSP